MNKFQGFIRTAAVLMSLAFGLWADDPVFKETGIGARAMAMGNSYVALANDYSAVFWNPAGLGFTPVREIQIGIDGTRLQTQADFGSSGDDITKNRMRLSHAGMVRAVPASQGGLSYAVGFSSPINFDNTYSYFGSDTLIREHRSSFYGYYDQNNNIIPDTLYPGNDLFYQEVTNAVYGQLRMINLAVGWQIGPGFSFGFSINPVFGSSHEMLRVISHRTEEKKRLLFQNSMETYRRSFHGMDARLGFMYRPIERISIGARFDLPQYIRMKLDYEFVDSTYMSVLDQQSGVYTIKRPFSGAGGAAFVLPFGTLAVQGTFRAPFFEAAENSPQSYFRLGGSAGLEVPVPYIPVILRAGYKWQQFDWYPYLYGEGAVSHLAQPDIDSDNGEHTASLGFAIMFKDAAALEFAYSYFSTDVEIINKDWRNDLLEKHRDHRAQLQLSFRY